MNDLINQEKEVDRTSKQYESHLGQAWIEVDLDMLATNVKNVKEYIGSRRMMAVLKGNGYGLGAIEIAKTALANGATDIGVASIAEGIELRNAGIAAPILVFNPLLKEQIGLLVTYDLTGTVFDMDTAREISKEASLQSKVAKVHIKIDTGLGRFGIFPEEAISFVKEIKELSNLNVEGIYTHFARAYQKKQSYTQDQFNKFMSVLAELAALGYDFKIKHAANSAAVVTLSETYLDMVRVGNLIYGIYPVETKEPVIEIRQIWSLKSKILHTRHVKKGTRVGYGSKYVTPTDRYLASIGVGWGDGLNLEPSFVTIRWRNLAKLILFKFLTHSWFAQHLEKKAWYTDILARVHEYSAEIQDIRVPIVGRPSMQNAVVDVTSLSKKPQAGDVVSFDARIVTISARLARLYIKDKQPYKVINLLGEYDLQVKELG